ncbi:hypothetical protein ACWCO3_17270 [Micromonospora sp. NPDC002411]
MWRQRLRHEKGCCCPMAHFGARTSTLTGPIVVALTGDPRPES